MEAGESSIEEAKKKQDGYSAEWLQMESNYNNDKY